MCLAFIAPHHCRYSIYENKTMVTHVHEEGQPMPETSELFSFFPMKVHIGNSLNIYYVIPEIMNRIYAF